MKMLFLFKLLYIAFQLCEPSSLIELSISHLKEGQNCGSNPSLRNLFVKSLIAHHAPEPILKVE